LQPGARDRLRQPTDVGEDPGETAVRVVAEGAFLLRERRALIIVSRDSRAATGITRNNSYFVALSRVDTSCFP